ncbi:MAG: hypothetical protein ACUVXA_09610 [Candidatus Jordarchaeum sp.]|uniref:hypothetical protein n=1 Tax=Candidatus Jordarchaeum sp. TaxID=2823881 RepID=UPI004049739F
MGLLLLVFLAVVVFVFYGLHAAKLEPQKPKILIPLVVISILIVVAAFLTQKPWWTEFLQALNNLL